MIRMYLEINSLHLKIDGLEDDISFLGARPIVRGKLAARFRTCFSCMADQLLRKIPNFKGNRFFSETFVESHLDWGRWNSIDNDHHPPHFSLSILIPWVSFFRQIDGSPPSFRKPSQICFALTWQQYLDVDRWWWANWESGITRSLTNWWYHQQAKHHRLRSSV